MNDRMVWGPGDLKFDDAPEEKAGTSEGARKGWEKRQRGSSANETPAPAWSINASGSPESVLYHGTVEAVLQDVLKDGLRPAKPDERLFGKDFYQGQRGQAVYVTNTIGNARNWAWEAAQHHIMAELERRLGPPRLDNDVYYERAKVERPKIEKQTRIVVFEVDAAALALKKDKEATNEDAYYHVGTIPPEYIKGYDTFDASGNKRIGGHIQLKSKQTSVYVPIIIITPDEVSEPDESN